MLFLSTAYAVRFIPALKSRAFSHKFPVKKIPESEKAEKIVKTVNSMAHSLDIKTVAEFVENKGIVEKLEKLGIDYAQGYYFEEPKILV